MQEGVEKMNLNTIGSADGPTTIFLVGELGESWLNLFGLIIVVLIMIPNIIYAIKFRDTKNLCENKIMNILEQIGRYASMFLMIFNIGIAEFGFTSIRAFLMYMFGNIILLLLYWIIWILYFIKQNVWKSIALALIPSFIFLLCGITSRHILLIISAIIFGIGHTYVTYQNVKK